MNHIVAPTDFSSVSHNAVLYAAEFAERIGASLVVVHGRGTPHTVVAGSSESDNGPSEVEHLNLLVNQLKSRHPDLVILSKVLAGKPVAVILSIAQQFNSELIIIGTQGVNAKGETFLGSTAVSLIRKRAFPILAIPYPVKFRGIDHLLFAVKNPSVQLVSTLAPLVSIKRKFKSYIHLLQVNNSSPERNKSYNLIQVSDDLHIVKNDSLYDATLGFFEEEDADMVAVINRKTGFFSDLETDESLPAQKFNSRIPVLVLNEYVE